MDLGKKILELRKNANLSQEQLAEKMKVTRQTISKWELNETTPDIKQARELSKLFKVSLDDLTDNDVKSVLVEKVSNTEKLAGIIIKILKVLGILFITYVIILVGMICVFSIGRRNATITAESKEVLISCIKGDKTYEIVVGNDEKYLCKGCSEDMTNEIEKIISYKDLDISVRNIRNYFQNINGTCD